MPGSNKVNKRPRVEYAPARVSSKPNSHGQSHGSSQGTSHGSAQASSHGQSRSATRVLVRGPRISARDLYSSDEDDGQGSIASSNSSSFENVEDNKEESALDMLVNIGHQISAISTRLDHIEDHLLRVPQSAISTSTSTSSSTASSDAMPSRKVTAALLVPLAPKQLRTLKTLSKCLQRRGEVQTMERSLFLQWLNDIIDILLSKFTNPSYSTPKKDRKQQLKQITMLIVECLKGWGFQDTDHLSAIYDDLSMQVNT